MWLLGFLTFYILISEDKELTLTFIKRTSPQFGNEETLNVKLPSQ